MAFEIADYKQHLVITGRKGVFNVIRTDWSSTVEQYSAYANEDGSYIIQQTLTSGTTGLKIYKYYGRSRKASTTFDTDWTNRASLTYIEYWELLNTQ